MTTEAWVMLIVGGVLEIVVIGAAGLWAMSGIRDLEREALGEIARSAMATVETRGSAMAASGGASAARESIEELSRAIQAREEESADRYADGFTGGWP